MVVLVVKGTVCFGEAQDRVDLIFSVGASLRDQTNTDHKHLNEVDYVYLPGLGLPGLTSEARPGCGVHR